MKFSFQYETFRHTLLQMFRGVAASLISGVGHLFQHCLFQPANVCMTKPVFSYALEKFGDSPCSSLMVLRTRGVQAAGEETLMPPLGRVQSSEEVLTRMWTVSIGGMIPRLTTSTVLSKSSSITTCPVTPD